MTAADAVDVPTLIDQHRISRFQIQVAALCGAVVMMDGFDTQAIGYVAPAIIKAWQIEPAALAPVFAAGLAGLMVGALIFGPVADRVGRKAVIIFCAAFFGICSLATGLADSLSTMLTIRFVTGLGLGGAMPNAIALTAEYSPQRSRATMIMVMFCGFSVGSALGGLLAAHMVPSLGWPSVFYFGGIAPLLLVPLLLRALPESIRFLVLKGSETRRVAGLLERVNPALVFGAEARFVIHEEKAPGFPVKHLFQEGRSAATLCLWVMFFMNLLDLYFLANWLPTVIHNAGISVELAVTATALLQVGGIVGTVILGRLIDWFGPYRILAIAYLAAGMFIALIGSAGTAVAPIMVTTFGAGFCVVGAQIGANALAATVYPTFIRSTGVGWALGIGRIGSIIGPVLGGMMLAFHWPAPTLFAAGAVPALLAAAAALIMRHTRLALARSAP